ncbi:MAG TPA: DUF4340 domain-containing protein [Stellaceae bacterium]|nr:DUF4340 domain-containing protein [Stellaceae bacterium]
MQRRGFILLLAATVVMVAGAVLSLRTGEGTVTRAAPGERALPGLAPKLGALARVRLTRGAMKADFAQIGGHWVVAEKGNYPADEPRVRRLLLGLADLELVEPKTKIPALFPRLDVDDPASGKSTEVVVQDTSGQVVGQLIVGKSRPDRLGGGNTGVYVRRVGEDRAWLARGSVDVSGDVIDWLDRHILDIPAGRIATMIFVGAHQGVAVIGRHGVTDPFAVENVPAGAKLKGQPAISAPAAALEGLDLIDVKPLTEEPVPRSGVATAAFTTVDGLTLRLRLFETDGKDWIAIEADSAGKGTAAESKAINARVGHWAYAIPPYKAKMLRTRLEDMLVPEKGP